MPDWCNNFITVIGDKDKVQKFVEKVTKKEKGFYAIDFNKIIPCDKTDDSNEWRIKHWGCKWNACDTVIYNKDYLLHDKSEVYLLPHAQKYINILHFSFIGDTKKQRNQDIIMIFFCTPWDYPAYIIDSMIKQNPQLKFICMIAYPSHGTANIIVANNDKNRLAYTIDMNRYGKSYNEMCSICCIVNNSMAKDEGIKINDAVISSSIDNLFNEIIFPIMNGKSPNPSKYKIYTMDEEIERVQQNEKIFKDILSNIMTDINFI